MKRITGLKDRVNAHLEWGEVGTRNQICLNLFMNQLVMPEGTNVI